MITLMISDGSGSEFFGFGLAGGPCFRVRVHRVLNFEKFLVRVLRVRVYRVFGFRKYPKIQKFLPIFG